MVKRTCAIEECDNPARGRGWCSKHYKRWRKHGDPLASAPGRGTCTAEGCGRPHYGHGLCQGHYHQKKRGIPLRPIRSQSPEARFWSKVDGSGPEACWLWTAHRNQHDYGQLRTNGVLVLAHRYAYELLVGPIPEDLTLDHLCRTPACVNPSHLEPVTQAENTRRAAAYRTHCVNGHPFDEANTSVRPDGSRRCRRCHTVQETQRRRSEVSAR